MQHLRDPLGYCAVGLFVRVSASLMRPFGRPMRRNARGCVVVVLLCASACSSGSATPSATSAPTGPAGSVTSEPPVTAAPSSPGSDVQVTLPVTTSSKSGTEPAAAALFGALPTGQVDAATATALQGVVDGAVTVLYPSVIAAVVTPHGVWSGAAGIDGPDGRLATPQDMFAIASISKMFTAAMMMRLADQGKIDLDKPLSEYLGDLGADANGATVREALGMRSGIPDTADASIAEVVAAPDRVWTAAEVVAEFPKPVAKAGLEFNYSNPTYKLLDLAAEHVTGAGLSEVIRSEVLDPAGLPATPLVQGADTPTPKPWALPTQPGDLEVAKYGTGRALPSVAVATYSLAASGMASNASSLASWAWQLFAGEIVSAQSLTAMTTIGHDGYGLGIQAVDGVGPPPVFGHGGSTDGYQSLLAVIPNRQLVIVVFVNRRDANVSSIAANLAAAVKP